MSTQGDSERMIFNLQLRVAELERRNGSARRRSQGLMIGLAVVIALAMGGVGYASIPDSSGVIHACYDKNGNLEIVNSASDCAKKDTAISWNQTGPQGLQGPQGAQGPVGPQGLQGVAGKDGATGAPGAQGPAGKDGAVGANGAPGKDGAAGPQGATGPAGMTWRGPWSSSTQYEVNDAVSDGGSSWIAVARNMNAEPSATNSAWNLLAQGASTGGGGTGGGGGNPAHGSQAFSMNGTFTVPVGVTQVTIQAWGAGGGGGGGSSSGNPFASGSGGGGGGAGGYATASVTVPANDVFTVTVGSGGSGSVPGTATNGASGANTMVADASQTFENCSGGLGGSQAGSGGSGGTCTAVTGATVSGGHSGISSSNSSGGQGGIGIPGSDNISRGNGGKGGDGCITSGCQPGFAGTTGYVIISW